MPSAFVPAQLGPVTLRNRIIKSATFEGRTPDGLVTDELIDYHLAPSRGGVGLTTVAYLAIAPEGRTHGEQIVVGSWSAPGLARLADAIHETGAKISGQLGHAGPVANGRSNGHRAISASAMPSPLSMQMIRGANEGDITRITYDYVRAARHLVDAGFDVLEVHLAHSYLLSAFLAPGLNRRRDRWGGSLANRARFARQVVRAVRDEVGDQVAVIAKLGMSDGSPAGVSVPESLEVAQWLEQDGCLDALELSAGSSLLNPMYLFRGDVPLKEFAAQMPGPVRLGLKTPVGRKFFRAYEFHEAFLRENALKFRGAVSMPLVQLGGINDRATIDQSMADGFEFVAMARALLREPDLVTRLAEDEAARGRCIHCNQCMPTIYTGTRCTQLPPPPR